MSKDEFDIAMKLAHGNTIIEGIIVNIINEGCFYQKMFTTGVSDECCYFVPVGSNDSYMISITFDDLLTQFYSFGL